MTFTDSLYGRTNTIKTYTSLFNRHISPVVTPEECQSWDEKRTRNIIDYWEQKKLSHSTQSTLLRVLAKYVKFNNGPKIDTARLTRLISRKVQETELFVLNSDQANKLMLTCQKVDPAFYPVLLLALHAGLRRGEVYGLIIEDVDLIKMRIRIARSYNGPTKSGKTRYVPMSKHLSEALMEWAFHKGLKDRFFKLEDPNPRLRNVCREAGLPQINFHTLRHTFATLALESGTSPRKVQQWLGHASLTTTLNIYWGIINNTDEEALSFLPGG